MYIQAISNYLTSDHLLFLIVEDEGCIEPIIIFELEAVASQSPIKGPQPIDIRMQAIEDAVTGSSYEGSHVPVR